MFMKNTLIHLHTLITLKWREIFNSWLTETIWGKSGYKPSVDEYLETGMISIATHILVLTSSCFLNPSLPRNKVKPPKYENITQSLMATTRLLNDIQSYQVIPLDHLSFMCLEMYQNLLNIQLCVFNFEI